MNHPPTDPIRLLLEAAEKYEYDKASLGGVSLTLARETADVSLKTVPALTALVAEREKVRALVAEWRADAATHLNPNRRAHYKDCADRLAAILEGK